MEKRLRLRHRIEYTRNKHSRAVYSGGTIVIRLARNLTKTEQEEHIRNLLRRMTMIILREHRKIPVDPFRQLLEGQGVLSVRLASGRTYGFTLTPGPGTRAQRTQHGFLVTVGPRLRRRALHRFLWSLLARAESASVRAAVERVNRETFAVPIRSVRLRFALTQWGSCSRHGVIMLNAALLFLPEHLLEYVIIHELAHYRVANHSPAYWQLVESALPRYREMYKALQEYRLPQDD